MCAKGVGVFTFGEEGAGAECHANFMLIESFLLLCGKYNS